MVDGADSEKGGLEIRPGMLVRLAPGKMVEGNQKFESGRPGCARCVPGECQGSVCEVCAKDRVRRKAGKGKVGVARG